MNVELHIEALVLEGIRPRDGDRIGVAVQSELTRLFAKRGVPPALARGGTVPYADGGVVEARPDARPDVIGAQIAQAVYEGLWH
jgi:hypothetical protein